MSLPREAHITLADGQSKLLFAWEAFDGDDCFQIHYVIVTTADGSRRFDFGPCVVWGLRKLDRLLRKVGEPLVGSGFRNPDIRSWDLYRDGDDFRLAIRFPDQQFEFERTLKNPDVHNDRSFIQRYDDE